MKKNKNTTSMVFIPNTDVYPIVIYYYYMCVYVIDKYIIIVNMKQFGTIVY